MTDFSYSTNQSTSLGLLEDTYSSPDAICLQQDQFLLNDIFLATYLHIARTVEGP